MKPNDVPATLQGSVRRALVGASENNLADDLHTTPKNIAHALGTNGDRPVTWDFIGRLAFYRPDLWAQIVAAR